MNFLGSYNEVTYYDSYLTRFFIQYDVICCQIMDRNIESLVKKIKNKMLEAYNADTYLDSFLTRFFYGKEKRTQVIKKYICLSSDKKLYIFIYNYIIIQNIN